MDRVLRLTEVQQITGISRTSIWRLEKKGLFPNRRNLGPRCIGWTEKEVLKWMERLPRKAPSFAAGQITSQK